ncbi:MAG: hypothetical protein KAU38_00945 [Desulfobacterales bacterium]|nr:hypothetical protein [Desulfobacterales bacterium]
MKKKDYGAGLIVVFVIAAFLGLAAAYAKAEPAKSKSECIACHTDLNRIIRLSSEIEKIRPKLGKLAEASGEC